MHVISIQQSITFLLKTELEELGGYDVDVALNGTEAIHTLLEGRVKDAEVMVSSYAAKDATTNLSVAG